MQNIAMRNARRSTGLCTRWNARSDDKNFWQCWTGEKGAFSVIFRGGHADGWPSISCKGLLCVFSAKNNSFAGIKHAFGFAVHGNELFVSLREPITIRALC